MERSGTDRRGYRSLYHHRAEVCLSAYLSRLLPVQRSQTVPVRGGRESSRHQHCCFLMRRLVPDGISEFPAAVLQHRHVRVAWGWQCAWHLYSSKRYTFKTENEW